MKFDVRAPRVFSVLNPDAVAGHAALRAALWWSTADPTVAEQPEHSLGVERNAVRGVATAPVALACEQ